MYETLEGLTPKTISEAVTKENYGDWVDYGIDVNGDEDTTNDWKIFYKGKEGEANEGKVFIIAADYVPTSNTELTQVMLNTSNKLTTSSGSSYSDYCVRWPSSSGVNYTCNDGHKQLNVQTDEETHEQCSFPDIFESTKYYSSEHVGDDGKSGNENSRCVSQLQCTGVWSPFANDYADYAIGGPTLEMWIASWNQKHGETNDSTSKLYCGAEGTGYKVGTNESSLSTMISGSSYYGSNDDGYGDTLYFPHKSDNLGDVDSDDSNEYCTGYWLASQSAYSSDRVMYVSYKGNVASLRYNDDNYGGVRPLVCLNSTVSCQYNQEKNLYTLK